MCVPSARRGWTDIDADDAEDPTACSTYAAEIMENLFLAEVGCLPVRTASYHLDCASSVYGETKVRDKEI